MSVYYFNIFTILERMTEFRAKVLYDFAAEGETELNIRQPRIIWIGFFAYFETKTEIIKGTVSRD